MGRRGGERGAAQPRSQEGRDGEHQQSEARRAEQVEPRILRAALELQPVDRDPQRTRVRGARIDREEEGPAALQPRQVDGDRPVRHLRIGLDVEHRHDPILGSDRNFRWFN